LNRVSQQGFDQQSSAISLIRSVVAYDGGPAHAGKRQSRYSGISHRQGVSGGPGESGDGFPKVTSKQLFPAAIPGGRAEKFIVEDVVWDSRLGVYANRRRRWKKSPGVGGQRAS